MFRCLVCSLFTYAISVTQTESIEWKCENWKVKWEGFGRKMSCPNLRCSSSSSYGSTAQYGPWPSPLGFHNNNLFTGLDCVQCPTPNLEDQTSVFITPGDRVAQLYTQALGTHFSRLLQYACVTVGLFFNPGHHTGEFKVLRPHFPWRTEANHERPQSGQLVSGLRFEAWTSGIWRSVNYLTTMFGQLFSFLILPQLLNSFLYTT
jgi:hypothetical protein